MKYRGGGGQQRTASSVVPKAEKAGHGVFKSSRRCREAVVGPGLPRTENKGMLEIGSLEKRRSREKQGRLLYCTKKMQHNSSDVEKKAITENEPIAHKPEEIEHRISRGGPCPCEGSNVQFHGKSATGLYRLKQ